MSEFDEVHNDAKVMEKGSALRLALSQLVGEFGKESMLSLQLRAPVISTGSLKLDLALGIGGLPKHRRIKRNNADKKTKAKPKKANKKSKVNEVRLTN
ncbi:DNA recombination and repair protein RecA [Dillenia turbinata]|uniref:DNA recombination and repair protein RecA n=1 Tax=Dillenia turbinata TaxID=194707 RepID=A0AAN8ZU13_9MAGN